MSLPDLHRVYKASDVLEEVLCYIKSCIQEIEVMKACSEVFGSGPVDINYDEELEHLDKSMDQVAEVYFYLVNKDHPEEYSG